MYSLCKNLFIGVCPWNGNFEGARKAAFFPSYRLCPGANYVDNKKSHRQIEHPVSWGVHQTGNNTTDETFQGIHLEKFQGWNGILKEKG